MFSQDQERYWKEKFDGLQAQWKKLESEVRNFSQQKNTLTSGIEEAKATVKKLDAEWERLVGIRKDFAQYIEHLRDRFLTEQRVIELIVAHQRDLVTDDAANRIAESYANVVRDEIYEYVDNSISDGGVYSSPEEEEDEFPDSCDHPELLDEEPEYEPDEDEDDLEQEQHFEEPEYEYEEVEDCPRRCKVWHFSGIHKDGLVECTVVYDPQSGTKAGAWCCQTDNFCRKTGRALAYARLCDEESVPSNGMVHADDPAKLPYGPNWARKVVWYPRKQFMKVIGQ